MDASVLVAASSDAGTEGRWCEEILSRDFLVAPELVLVEATNVLRRLETSKRLSPLQAGAAARDLLDLPLELVPFVPFADRIWVLRENLTSFDAWYVAVAEELELPLATLDGRLSQATGPRCRFLLPPVS